AGQRQKRATRSEAPGTASGGGDPLRFGRKPNLARGTNHIAGTPDSSGVPARSGRACARPLSTLEANRERDLLAAPHDAEVHLGRLAVERVVQIVCGGDRLATDRDDQVALADAGG